jgi:hypothetical protein
LSHFLSSPPVLSAVTSQINYLHSKPEYLLLNSHKLRHLARKTGGETLLVRKKQETKAWAETLFSPFSVAIKKYPPQKKIPKTGYFIKKKDLFN